MANVVAIANVGELETTQRAEFFVECKKMSEGLARMEFIGERVDHRNVGIGGHFLEDALLVDAGDDALHPAIEIARHVGDGLASAERRGGLGVVEKNHRATHALDADVEGDARAERGLLKNQRDEFAVERGSVTHRAGLDVRRELEQFARMRRAPFRSGEEIVRQRNRRNKSRRSHFFHLAAAWATRPGFADLAESGAEACCGVVVRTSSKSLRNSRTCARVMINGGRKRNVKSCVQLMSKPLCMPSLTNDPP